MMESREISVISVISVLAKTEKSEITLAMVEGFDTPVVVKRLKNTNTAVFHQIMKLNNSHLPRIYSVTEEADTLVIVEEFIEGINLAEYCRQHPLTEEELFDIELQLCEAVKALHNCEPAIIHRDIKPKNIIITDENILVLVDFDASREYRIDKQEDTRRLGTVEYAPPEQFGYSQTDIRSDIYAMGVVFYELLYGTHFPKSEEKAEPTQDAIKIPMQQETAERMIEIINKCTMFDPKNRYASVDEIIDFLRNPDKYRKPKQGKKGILAYIAAGLAFLCGCVLLIKGFSGNNPVETPEPTKAAPTEQVSPTEPGENAESGEDGFAVFSSVQNFFKNSDREQNIYCYDHAFEQQSVKEVICTAEEIGFRYALEPSEYTMHGNIVQISNELLNRLEPRDYMIKVFVSVKESIFFPILIHGEEEEYFQVGAYVNNSMITYNKSEQEEFRFEAVVCNIGDRRIASVKAGEETIPEEKYTRILDGRGFTITDELINEFCKFESNYLNVQLDDETICKIIVNVVEKTKVFPKVEIRDYQFDRSAPEDIVMDVVWNDYPDLLYIGIDNQGNAIPKEDYDTLEDKIVIHKDYLSNLEAGLYTWVLEFGDAGCVFKVEIK